MLGLLIALKMLWLNHTHTYIYIHTVDVQRSLEKLTGNQIKTLFILLAARIPRPSSVELEYKRRVEVTKTGKSNIKKAKAKQTVSQPVSQPKGQIRHSQRSNAIIKSSQKSTALMCRTFSIPSCPIRNLSYPTFAFFTCLSFHSLYSLVSKEHK